MPTDEKSTLRVLPARPHAADQGRLDALPVLTLAASTLLAALQGVGLSWLAGLLLGVEVSTTITMITAGIFASITGILLATLIVGSGR